MLTRIARRAVVVSALLAALLAAAPTLVAEEEASPTLTVIGARVHPVRIVDAKPKPWDADHGAIPAIVYRQIGALTGFPPIAVLGLIPYRNRPDPFVVVRAGEDEWARSSSVQGAFAPAWLLSVPLAHDEGLPAVLTFEVFDDDLKDDDRIGKAMLETQAILAKPGKHVLEGTGGLHDLTIVVRNPAVETAGDPVALTLERVHVKAREQRPARGDWDAGGNPLRGRMPRRIPLPEKLEGVDKLKPDLRVTLDWGAGGARSSVVMDDAFELAWNDLDWEVQGREGVGDGLYVRVADLDLLVVDSVGVVYVPFEDFLAAREKGVLVIEPDELNGVERLEITFSVE